MKKVALADQVALKFAFSLREVSEVTGECRSNLYLAISSGALKAKKRRGSTIVLADDLREYLKALPAYTPNPSRVEAAAVARDAKAAARRAQADQRVTATTRRTAAATRKANVAARTMAAAE